MKSVIPFRREPLVRPTLSKQALHGLVGEVVEALGPYSEADEAALAMEFIAIFGAMAFDENGNRPFAEADAATHPALLNVLVVGATAHARKSTAHLQIRRLMAKANPEFFEAHVQNGFNSGEALLDTVQEAPHHSLLAVEQEFGRVLVVAQREGSILSLIIRQAWDGDPLRVRSRQKSVNVPTRGCPVRRGICSGGPPPDPCQLVGIGRSAKNIRDRGPPP